MTAQPSRRARVTVASIAAAALAAGVVSTTASAAEPAPSAGTTAPTAVAGTGPLKSTAHRDKLGQHDRALLATARSEGTKRVTLILDTVKGQTASVAASVRANGGFTSTTNDRIGYVRAAVPTSAVEKVVGLAKVLAVDLDESIPLPDPSVERSSATVNPAAGLSGPDASTPDSNPYMPTNETGSVAFRTAHPTWDGRGVTIGILDSGVDLDHPALQTTTTGARKIVDWVTATDPIFDNDASWRPMVTAVTGPSASYGGSTWTLPTTGGYKINLFDESITEGSEPEGDVNRDGDTSDTFGVLYNSTTHDVWVDSDQNHAFAAAEKLRPFKENGAVGHFGTDNPGTDVVERMPFVVEFREDVDMSPVRRHLGRQEGRLRQHRHPRGRPRHPRGRHRRRQEPVRRHHERRGARRQDRLVAGLHLGRRLHRGRAHRRHGRPRRQPRGRRRQHVDRRPARPQRRQQRPRPPLRPAHRRSTACSSSSRPATAAPVSTRSATRPSRAPSSASRRR